LLILRQNPSQAGEGMPKGTSQSTRRCLLHCLWIAESIRAGPACSHLEASAACTLHNGRIGNTLVHLPCSALKLSAPDSDNDKEFASRHLLSGDISSHTFRSNPVSAQAYRQIYPQGAVHVNKVLLETHQAGYHIPVADSGILRVMGKWNCHQFAKRAKVKSDAYV
jgi:hypothetical protein